MCGYMVTVDAVVVTFNRLDLLKRALDSYDSQTSPFRNLIVVDNCSSDGTYEFLEEWKQLPHCYNCIVYHSPENLGGAGGFAYGQSKAIELDADWVFVADDDAILTDSLFEKFYAFCESRDTSELSAICSSVMAPSGRICYAHRARWYLRAGRYYERKLSVAEDYSKESFSIDFLSYVGSFLSCRAMRQVGIADSDFFIFYDDSEHSFRLKEYGEIICVPGLVVIHEGETEVIKEWDLSWRDYYTIRNSYRMLLKNMPAFVVIRMVLSFLLLRGRNISDDKRYLKIYRIAVRDAIMGKMGKDRKYQPGWMPDF